MKHSDLYKKMRSAKWKQSTLLIGCNIVLVAVVFFFASLALNSTFMNEELVDPFISSNVLLPTAATLAFMCFFIPYSFFSYHRQKTKEYGILEAVGIDKNETRNMVIQEDCLLSACILIIGLLVGSGISILFYLTAGTIMGIEGLRFTAGLKSYGYVTVIFTIVMVLTVIALVLYYSRMTTRKLLMENRKHRRGIRSHVAIAFIGFAVVAGPLFYALLCLNQENRNNLLFCYGFFVVGIILMMMNSSGVIDFLKKRKSGKYYSRMIYYSNIRYKFADNINLFIFIICLMGIVVFLQAFSITSMKLGMRNNEQKYPFQIVICSFEKNSAVSDAQIDKIAKDNKIQIEKNYDIRAYVTEHYDAVFSSESVSSFTNKNYKLKNNECLVFSEYRLDDGYPHDKIDFQGFTLDDSEYCKPVHKYYDILLNNDLIARYCIIVNDHDYQKLKRNASYEEVNFRMITCKSLEQSQTLLEGIMELDNLDRDDIFISNQAEDAKNSKVGMHFLIFVVTLMNLLLIALMLSMLHFRMMSGISADIRRFRSMQKIGYTREELCLSFYAEIKTLTVIPAMIAVIAGGGFAIGLMRVSHLAMLTFFYTVVMGIIILVAAHLFSWQYTKYYIRKVT